MKDTRELIDELLADDYLLHNIRELEHLQEAAVSVAMRIQERIAAIEAQVSDIAVYVQPRLDDRPAFPGWLASEIMATTSLLVAAINDWERPIEVRDPAARLLQRALFGREHAPADWWDTMTGADMAFAIGYTHAEVPLSVAPRVLRVTRPGVHWLRTNRGLELTDRSFYAHIQASQDWRQAANRVCMPAPTSE